MHQLLCTGFFFFVRVFCCGVGFSTAIDLVWAVLQLEDQVERARVPLAELPCQRL